MKEAVRLIEADGWLLHAMRGSHRQFEHTTQAGTVTIAGKPSDDLSPGPSRASRNRLDFEGSVMRYAIVIEKAEGNCSAHVPDLPGCVATGETVADIEREMHQSIGFHLHGLRRDGITPPEPTSVVDYVDAR